MSQRDIVFLTGRGPRSDHWCFTLYEPTLVPAAIPATVRYMVYQVERCPSTDRLHIQGYVQCVGRQYGSFISSLTSALFAGRPSHNEAAKGTDGDNETYCTKEDSRVEGPFRFGEREPRAGIKGGRSDVMQLQKDLDEGMSVADVSKQHFSRFLHAERGIRSYKRLHTKARNAPPEIFCFIGPSGCGKTRLVHDAFPTAYWHPGGPWWDDYDGEQVVVFDEFYGHKLSFSQLLSVLDRYPLRCQTKGGSVQLSATTFVFTSNQHPSEWYNSEKTHQTSWAENPLNRRLQEYGHLVQFTSTVACPYCATPPGLCAFHHP